MRDPLMAISRTLAGPPTSTVPWMKIATKPDSITTIWNTSVQITAFMPPCVEREDTQAHAHAHRFQVLLQVRGSGETEERLEEKTRTLHFRYKH